MAAAAFAIKGFAGMLPQIAPRLLPPNAAVTAANCDMRRGLLEGINHPTVLHTFASTMLRAFPVAKDDGSTLWVGFADDDIDFVKGPLVNDAYDRCYWAGLSQAKPQYNTQERIEDEDPPYYLGIPPPDTTPTLNVTGGSGVLENRAYVYTFVSEYGEEGPPSPPITASGYENSTWQLGNLDTTVPDGTNRPDCTKRIYRTVAGKSSTDYFYVADVSLATTTYNDTNLSSFVALNDGLQSEQWFAPPDNMEGLVVHPNGFLVGWKGRDLYFSEPYRPHAWPPGYVLSTETPIIGLGITAQTVVVLTKTLPYTCTGGQPAAMTLAKIEAAEPCLNRYGIVSHRHGVIYPSRSGLVAITPNGAEVITRGVLTSEQWINDYQPESYFAANHGGRYVSLRPEDPGFMFVPTEKQQIWSLLVGYNASMVQTNPYTGNAYILSGNTVYAFDPEDSFSSGYLWKSKRFSFERPVNFGACRFELDVKGETQDFLEVLFAYNEERIQDPLAPLGSAMVGGVTYHEPIVGYEALDMNRDPFGGSPLFTANDVKVAGNFIVLTVWADDVLVFNENVYESRQVKLPAGFKATTYQFQFESNMVVSSFAVAETGRGLAAA